MSSKEEISRLLRPEIQRLPASTGVYADRKGNMWLRCPWHSGGHERTPSLTIFLDVTAPCPVGFFHCLGCKTKGQWNEFAELFGLRKLRAGQVKAAGDMHSALQHFNLDEEPNVPNLNALARWSPAVPWRSVPGPTVHKYGGRSIMFGRQNMLYFPVTLYDEHVGGIQCRLERNYEDPKEKAYINTPGKWSEDSLFGYDQAIQKPDEPLWIVEGPRDTTWVDACGPRVTGLIGSFITPRKLRLLRSLDPPCILGALDPDAAGDGAWNQLYDALHREYPIIRYPFKEGEDPCDLTPERIQRANNAMLRYRAA